MTPLPATPDGDRAMRIAIVTDSFFPELGGIQDSILTTARELGRRGESVLILAPRPAARDFARAGLPAEEIRIGANVAVRRLFALPAPGSTGQSRLVVPLATIRQELAAFAPEVIHLQTFLGAGLAARAAAGRLGVKLVGTNHWAISGFGGYAPVAPAQMARLALRAVAGFYNRCAFTSAPSATTLAEMRAHGFVGAGGVISNPIDTARFRPGAPGDRAGLRDAFGLTGPTVVYAGRLAREKNIDVLIRALPALRQAVPGAGLVLAGHGTARAALAALAQALGVGAQVRFVGTLDHAALARLFQAADVFALPSLSESQGMALLQAMSAGLPVVAARHGALIEYVPQAVGRLALPGDAADTARQLASLLGAPVLREACGVAASAWAGGFGVTAVADMWQAAYRRVVGRHPASDSPAQRDLSWA